ncbi:glycosyltransferase family 2 protein [Celeribacter baekdonensis]|uniref:Glycosyl transferase n=1 Tax=Celeribacter baekdonensis TaxID=875171 RepID=A0A2R4M5X2_9RHOB|nr:glycosyl transferase [Celeribacter baekdonensis]
MPPKVSIIMPVYNAEAFLGAALQSVLDQTETDWELWAVEDASLDLSDKILTEFQKQTSRIHLIKNEKNEGAAKSRNAALERAQGRWIAFLDADDIWAPDKLKRHLAFLTAQNAVFGATDYGVISQEGIQLARRIVPARSDFKKLLKGNPIGTSTVIIARDTLGDLRFPDLHRRQDYALWLKLTQRGVICHGLHAPLTQYRRRTGSLSDNRMRAALATWQVYSTLPEISRMRAFMAYGTYLIRTSLKHLGHVDH